MTEHDIPALTLEEAISVLDPSNADHWTGEGLPRMDVIHAFTGDRTITRAQVTEVAPGLVRGSLEGLARSTAETGNDTRPPAPDPGAPITPAGEGNPEPVSPRVEEAVESAPAARAPSVSLVEGPLEDAEDAEVMTLPLPQVLGDYRLVRRALLEIDRQISSKLRQKSSLDREIAQLSAKNEMLKRSEISHVRRDPSLRESSGVKSYLESTRLAREERARRARAFIDAGTTAKDVAEQLRGTSKLDNAMRSRKPVPGSQRPPIRPPMNV